MSPLSFFFDGLGTFRLGITSNVYLNGFWFCLNGIGTCKKCPSFSMNIIYKTKKYFQETQICLRADMLTHKYVLPKCIECPLFFKLGASTMGNGFRVSISYPFTNFEKNLFPENVWMQY